MDDENIADANLGIEHEENVTAGLGTRSTGAGTSLKGSL
jgi:hypothetical protein